MSDFANIQFFLGANSAQGFASLYDQWVDQGKIQAFYCLKGGAGCGKSTLMGQVARRLEAEGYAVEYIRCSGDPDSLDGVRIPGKGAALVDGTSPHRMDPAYPGATGHYVDLGAGYDRKALSAIRGEILAAVEAYRSYYPEAYRAIAAAMESRRRGTAPLHTQETLARTARRAAALLEEELRTPGPFPGKEARRFLGGPTCQGRLLLETTVAALCQRVYEIRDQCGLAGTLLAHLRKGFLEGGCDVIACPSPEQPGRLAHLLIPQRSLAFVTGPLDSCPVFRTIRTENLVERKAWQEGKSFLHLSARVAEELLEEGMAHLAQAKACHDILEELYHPHVDFSCAAEQTQRLTEEILALPDQTPADPLAPAFQL